MEWLGLALGYYLAPYTDKIFNETIFKWFMFILAAVMYLWLYSQVKF